MTNDEAPVKLDERKQSQRTRRYLCFDSSLPSIVACDELRMAQTDNKATKWITVWAVSAPRWVCVCMCDCCNCNHSLCGFLHTHIWLCVCVCVYTYVFWRSSCIHVWLEMTQALLVHACASWHRALIELPVSAAWLQTDPGECVTAPSFTLCSSSSFLHSLPTLANSL